MIRLPDASAVGPTPNANSGRPIATVDLSGGARGLQQLGQGMQQAADAGFRVAETFKEDIDKQKAWDTATRWQDFQNTWKTKAQGMADSMQPGGVGTMEVFKTGYRADAEKFYQSIPENLKGAYRSQIYDYEGNLGGQLNGKVLTEKARYAGDQQTQMDNTFINAAASDPTNPNAAKEAAAKITTYTAANPNLPPIDKQTRLSKVNDTVATGLGAAIIANKDSVRQVFQPPAVAGAQQPLFMAEEKPAGLVSAGNIDLRTRPQVKNKDGTTSTVRTISYERNDGKEVLIPTVSDEGKIMSNREAMEYWGKKNQNLGVFDTPDQATAYAKKLHEQQDDWFLKGGKDRADQEQPASSATQQTNRVALPKMAIGPGQADRESAAMSYFMGRGYSREQAAGIVGNLVHESGGLNVKSRNPGDGSDGTDSIGIAQWNSTRAKNLKAFAAAQGRDWHDLGVQLAFVDHELNTNYSGVKQRLLAARTPDDAAGVFVTGYERPAGSEGGAVLSHGWANRRDQSRRLAGGNYTPGETVPGSDVAGTSADPYSTARSYFQRQFGDTVDPNVLNQLANAAVTARNQFNAESRQLITQVSQDAPTAIANSGRYTGTMPSRQDFEDAFGREAPQKYAAFQAGLQTAQSAFDMGTQSDADVKSTVAAAKAKMDATTGEGAALAASQYEMVAKAAEAALKARASDIVGYTQQHFPNVKTAWDTYAANPSADALSNAIGATTAAQTQLGTKGIDQAVLPSNIVEDFVARTKQPTRTTEQNMQDLAGLVFATNDPDQQQAIFNQLRKAGVPAEAETVLRAYGRQDKASARFLAAVIDAKSLPEKKEPGQIDSVANAVDRQMSDPAAGVAQTLYGMDIGQEGNLETYTTDRNVFIKGVKVKMLEGMAQDDAVKFVGKALYGDARVVDQGNAKIVTTGQQNDEAIVQGLSHQSGAIKQALSSYGLVHGMDGTPEERNSKAVIERLNQFRISDIMANGTWRNVGNGFGFVDNATGLFVGGKDGKPIIITPDRAEAEGLLRQSAAETVKKNLSATPVPPVNAPPPGNSPANVRPQSEWQPSVNMDGLGFNPPAPKQDSLMDFIPADQKAGPVPSMDSILKPESAN